MKTNYRWRNASRTPLALLPGIFMLGISLDVRSSTGAEAQNKERVYFEIPGLASPLPPAFVLAAALAQNPPRAAAETPAATADPPAVAAPASPGLEAAPVYPPRPSGTPADHANGKTLYSFQANELELKSALATFARANNLNIVPDNDVAGIVTLDVR